jgi:hypothetical protein
MVLVAFQRNTKQLSAYISLRVRFCDYSCSVNAATFVTDNADEPHSAEGRHL